MTGTCREPREYLSAIADDELDVVPPGTLEHVVRCPDCLGELTMLRLADARLRAALGASDPRPRRLRGLPTRLASLVAAAVVLVAVGGGLGAWQATRGGGGDEVTVAIAASRAQPVLRSADPSTISAWCSQMSSRPGPAVALSALAPTGARSDTSGSTTVVTVFYVDRADDARVTVGWITSGPAAVGASRVEARDAGGATVLVVQSPAGRAVVAGDAAPGVLWRIAGQIESATP